MSQAILTALRTKLATSTGSGGFFNVLTSRVYLESAPGDTALPLCVYSASNTRFERGMDNSRTEAVSVVFTAYDSHANGTTTLLTAMEALRTLLDGVDITPANFDRARCILRVRGVPVFEDQIWSISETYEIIGQRKA